MDPYTNAQLLAAVRQEMSRNANFRRQIEQSIDNGQDSWLEQLIEWVAEKAFGATIQWIIQNVFDTVKSWLNGK